MGELVTMRERKAAQRRALGATEDPIRVQSGLKHSRLTKQR
jgi:hypothetical protein